MSITPTLSEQAAEITSARVFARSRSIIPLGYVLIFILFAFSFCDFKCNVDKHIGPTSGSITGYDLIMGKYINANPLFAKPGDRELKDLLENIYKKYEDGKGNEHTAMHIPSNTWAILALAMAVIGLISFMFTNTYKPHVALVTGVLGTVFMILLNSSMSRWVNEQFSYMLQADFTYAYWLTTFAFAGIAIAGYYRLKYTTVVIEGTNEEQLVVNTNTITFEDFFSNHKWVLIAVLFVLSASIIFYKAYFGHDYTDDVKELAMDACNCDKEKADKEQKQFTDFIKKVRVAKADQVSSLRDDFYRMQNKISKDYGKCNNSVKHKFEELRLKAVNTEKYATEKDLDAAFEEYYRSYTDSLVDRDESREVKDKVERALDSLQRSGYTIESPEFMPPPYLN